LAHVPHELEMVDRGDAQVRGGEVNGLVFTLEVAHGRHGRGRVDNAAGQLAHVQLSRLLRDVRCREMQSRVRVHA